MVHSRLCSTLRGLLTRPCEELRTGYAPVSAFSEACVRLAMFEHLAGVTMNGAPGCLDFSSGKRLVIISGQDLAKGSCSNPQVSGLMRHAGVVLGR